MTKAGDRRWTAAELAEAARLSPRTVTLAIANLVRQGVIVRHGYGDDAHYRLS